MGEIGKTSHTTFQPTDLSFFPTADAITPLLDNSPINFHNLFCGNVIERLRALKAIGSLIKIS